VYESSVHDRPHRESLMTVCVRGSAAVTPFLEVQVQPSVTVSRPDAALLTVGSVAFGNVASTRAFHAVA
jgi:hypothetical protein